jgi:prephenate dehydrogenase
MRATVVGLGLIGGSIALALRARGYDREPKARARGRELGIRVVETLPDALRDTNFVVVAVSTSENTAVLREVAELAPQALLTDIASVKKPLLETETELPAHIRFVSGHPMAGSATPGLDGARADIFAGRPWLIVPGTHSSEKDIETLSAVVRRIGAIPRIVDRERHDIVMTWASHLPLVVAAALARAVWDGGGRDVGDLAGPGLVDTTRLADTPIRLALELSLADPIRLGNAMTALSKELADLAGALRAGDRDRVREFLEAARQARRDIRLGPGSDD